MKITKNTVLILSLGLLISMVFNAPASAEINYQENPGKITAETDNFRVQVTGGSNVPAFTFSSAEDNATRYHAQFIQLFEFEDSNNNSQYDQADAKDGITNVALASLNVDIGEIEESDNGDISFNMTLTTSGPDIQFDSLTFQNHLKQDNDTKLKFDVMLENYQFSSQNNNLAIVFKLSSNTANASSVSNGQENDVVRFGDSAYLESKKEAKGGNETIEVATSTNQTGEGTMAYLSYESFNGTLVHDPGLGLDETRVDTTFGGNDSESGDTPFKAFSLLGLAALPLLRKMQE